MIRLSVLFVFAFSFAAILCESDMGQNWSAGMVSVFVRVQPKGCCARILTAHSHARVHETASSASVHVNTACSHVHMRALRAVIYACTACSLSMHANTGG